MAMYDSICVIHEIVSDAPSTSGFVPKTPDIAAARCEDGVFGVSVRIAKVFTEGLGCDVGRDEIDLIVVVSDRNLILSPFVRQIFHICFPKVPRQKIGLNRTCIFQAYDETDLLAPPSQIIKRAAGRNRGRRDRL